MIGIPLGAEGVRQAGMSSLSPSNAGLPELATYFAEVGYIRLRWERVGVRGYGLSLGCNPSPGSHPTMLRIADAIRPLPMGEVRRRRRFSSLATALHHQPDTPRPAP